MTAGDPLVRFYDPDAGDPPPYVGIIGSLCGRQTIEEVVRKTPKGPLHRAKCTRWLDHPGDHEQRHMRTFQILHTWTDDDCREPNHKELHRVESIRSRAAVSFQITDPVGGDHFV